MSLSTLCRLCLCPFQENCKELINSSGKCTEAYGIASKYFDPMLLIAAQEQNSSILCSICWQHIQDFYYFQQTVFEAHSKLEDDKEIVSIVKVEVEQVVTPNSQVNKDVRQKGDDCAIESCDLLEVNTFSSEDEVPLMERFEQARKISDQKFKVKIRKKRKCMRKNQNLKSLEDILKSDLSNDSKLSDKHYEICNKNDKTDAQQKTLENDAFISTWRNELECVKCNATFANFSLLRKHFLKDHLDEKCYIVCCDRKFRSRYHIVEHIRLHMDPNAYRCDVCGKCSTNSRILAKHMKELHSEEGKLGCLECPTCLKTLANKNSLRVHMETHETNLTHICGECGKGFPTEQRKNLHEKSVHNADRICDQCGKTLHGPYALKRHLLEHAGVQKRKWPCDQCGAELHSHYSLKRHKLITHHDGSTVYECSDCGKVAATEISLLRHKKNVHQTERKFKCTICEKSFKYAIVLREHMATHTGEDLYQCPHCIKTFKTNANMHHHRKKAHPKEWAEARVNRPQGIKVDFNLVQNEVVI